MKIYQYPIKSLLAGGAITILKKYESQWEGWKPIYEMENKIHVPNHQPVSHGMKRRPFFIIISGFSLHQFFTKVRGKFEIQTKRPKTVSDHVTSIWTYQFCITSYLIKCAEAASIWITVCHGLPEDCGMLRPVQELEMGPNSNGVWSARGLQPFRLNELASPEGEKRNKYPKCTNQVWIVVWFPFLNDPQCMGWCGNWYMDEAAVSSTRTGSRNRPSWSVFDILTWVKYPVNNCGSRIIGENLQISDIFYGIL
jgi:hypothetical protein